MSKKIFHALQKQAGPKPVQIWVIRWACGAGERPLIRLEKLTRHGCISGLVSELIYTHDCLKFYARFEENIWDIITEFLDAT